MGSFNDWKGAAAAPGFLESLKAFGLKDGQINSGSELPEDERTLESLGVDAVHSDEARFTLDADANSGGTFYAYGFGGLFCARSLGGDQARLQLPQCPRA